MRQAAIRYTLGSMMVHWVSLTDAHVPSVVSVESAKNSTNRMVDVIKPLYRIS